MSQLSRIRDTFSLLSTPLFIILFLQPLTSLSQVIDPTKVPGCISSCNSIIAAQNLCAPPVTTAPDTVCFCNSNYLVPLKSGQTAGVCDNICTPQDMQA